MTPETRRHLWRDIRVQLPFLAWLIVLWMLLWAQFTVLSFLTGLVVAVFVTRVFRLPTVELSGRINLWYAALFVVQFVFAVVHGALVVTAQVLDFRRQPGAAIIAVPLRYADDLLMTHVSVVSSLIPGSLVVESDRDRRIVYLHVIGVRSRADVERQRAGVLRWEQRIVRALGDPAQYRALKADERAAGGGGAGSTARGSAGAGGSGAGGSGAGGSGAGDSKRGGAR
ncbi:Na+/H+ antiporter subunit E [Microbacterium sp. SD291]|uniref:Na+/H+ antiporter subunit E n=1 Tax=Microbacterium sp. SD291 TaxID=2782007 RepID=UPI001A9762B6|nr:Na+/H+ antiporter subunit E [Microbacterium sp. SD291]MBO0980360.1 Na+/H+ antiporter subunit E [Microbacterium sp. SD291]